MSNQTKEDYKKFAKKYFGKEVNTIYGLCYVNGFSNDEEHIILLEDGIEEYSMQLKDFYQHIKEYNKE